MASPQMAMPVAQPIAKPVAKVVAAPVAAAVATKPTTPKAAPVASAAAAPASAPSSSSADDGEVDAKILMDMPHTRAYLLVDGSKKLVENTTLEVMQSTHEGQEIYLLILGSLKLVLNIHVPCLEMAPRNFVFPTDDKTYGIIVPDAITDDVLDVFRILLTDHTSFREAATPQLLSELPDQPERVTGMANSVAAGLGAGSVVVATGVIKGGKMVGSLFMRGGNYLTQKLKPNEKASTVSEASKARLAKAKFVSGAAVKVSKALVVGAMATTAVMAHSLSEAIKETEVGRKLGSDPEKPNANLDAAKVVGKATIGAVLNVYQAMETAVFGVAHDVSSATVTVVTHKYGADAGAHTKESLGVVENVVVAAHGVKQLGVKSIAKATAIKTGQEVLTTPSERAEEERKKAEAAAAAGPAGAARQGLGHALGLPEGMDPLVAMEAMQAMSQLSMASQSVIAHEGAGAGDQRTYVTTATATGATPAQAHAAAQAAANEGAHAAMKH